jgi:hypothetical protein
MKLKRNMSKADIIIRLVIAAFIIVLYYNNAFRGIPGIILLVIAAVFILTSIFAFSPVYKIFRISSCASSNKDTKKKK